MKAFKDTIKGSLSSFSVDIFVYLEIPWLEDITMYSIAKVSRQAHFLINPSFRRMNCIT